MAISPGLLARYGIPSDRSDSWLDYLTGLPNRRYLLHLIDSLVSNGAGFSLLFLDMDRFKRVNDSMGHGEGDRVLEIMADILRDNVRVEDRPVRFGGDEFVVVIPGSGQEAPVGARLLEVVSSRMKARWGVTVSIGEASFPADASNPGELLRAADRAMYRAKEAGGNCLVRAAVSQGSLFWHEEVFVCREEETSRAVRALSSPESGGLIVEGAPGSGKTSFLEAIARSLPERNVYHIVCRPELSGIPWASLLSCSRQAASEVGETHRGIWAGVLARIFPGVFPEIEPGGVRPETLAVLEALSNLFSARSPLTLMADNAQWMDPRTSEFLGYALGVGIPMGLTLCLSTGTDALPALARVFRGYDRLARLRLEPLSLFQVGELVRARLGSAEPLPDTASRVHRFSGGNPLFACEFIRAGCSPEGSFSEEGLPDEDDSATIPERVEQIIQGRLITLPPQCLTVLQYASADRSGELDLGVIARSSGITEAEVMGFLDNGVKAGILGFGAEALLSYQFAGEGARLAVYASAPGSVTARAHRVMAEASKSRGDYLEAGYHYQRFGGFREAFECYREGAETCRMSGLPGAGLACLERAEALIPKVMSEPERARETIRIKEDLVHSLFDCGLWEKGRTVALEAAELAGREGMDERAAILTLFTADSLRISGDSRESAARIVRLLPSARGRIRVDALIRLADSLNRLHRAGEALDRLREAEELIGDDPRLRDKYAVDLTHKKLGCAVALGLVELGLEAGEEMIRAGETRGLDQWYFMHDVGEFHLLLGQPLKALTHFEIAEETAIRQGSFYGRTCCRALMVDACCLAFQRGRVEALVREVEELSKRLGNRLFPGEMALARCRLLLLGGHLQLAESSLQDYFRDSEPTPVSFHLYSLVLQKAGRFEEALLQSERAIDLISPECLGPIDANTATVTREEVILQEAWLRMRLNPSPDAGERIGELMNSSLPRAACRAAGLLAGLLREAGRTVEADAILFDSLSRPEWSELKLQRHENLLIGARWNPAFSREAARMEEENP